MATFFLCRLVWGSYMSVRVFTDVWAAYKAGHFAVGAGPLGMGEGGSSAVSEGIGGAWGKGGAWTGEGGRSEMMQYAGDQRIPYWLPGAYLGANLVLNTLNWVWFGKMVETIRKRFEPPFGTKGVGAGADFRGLRRKSMQEKASEMLVEGIDVDTDASGDSVDEKEVEIVRGVDEDGRKSVEVTAREVRKRRKA